SATVGTSATLSGMPAGSYTVTVTDANNCSKTSGAISLAPPSPALSAAPSSGSNPVCNGSPGQITAGLGSGGITNKPYQYSIDGNSFQTSNIFPILTAIPGSYSYAVTVKDDNGCSATAGSVTITIPPAVTITNAPFTSPTCNGGNNGSITVNASTATQYSKDNGANFQASNVFPALTAGTYLIVAKDAAGCTSVATGVIVTQPDAVSGTITQTAPINCNGKSTAALSVAPSGGSGSYATYSWSNGATTQNITNIPAGSYGVTITDSNNCTGTTSNFTVSQPTALTVAPSQTNVLCKGASNGAIDLSVSGGTGTKTYAWSNGATTQNISSLSPGTYSVTVTDANGCVNSSTSVTITEPASSVSVSLQTKTNVWCFGG
ncbi:MAG: SprB repeat-containing protein, partial [Cytophagales bacterium]